MLGEVITNFCFGRHQSWFPSASTDGLDTMRVRLWVKAELLVVLAALGAGAPDTGHGWPASEHYARAPRLESGLVVAGTTSGNVLAQQSKLRERSFHFFPRRLDAGVVTPTDAISVRLLSQREGFGGLGVSPTNDAQQHITMTTQRDQRHMRSRSLVVRYKEIVRLSFCGLAAEVEHSERRYALAVVRSREWRRRNTALRT